ncbi:MAG: glycosyltransferase [Sedimentisphaerales bacterium]|nr:glycosyltransferase [Sedimentisphaerales bacterium]
MFVSHAAGLSGSEKCLLALLKGLDKDKFEPLALLPEDGQLKQKLEELRIKTFVYPVERWIAYSLEHSKRHFKKVFGGLPRRVRFLSKLIRKEKIDVVYSNSIIVIDDAIAAKINGVPHIRHIHNFLVDNPYLRPYLPMPLTSVLLKTLSSEIIAVSDAVKRNFNFKRLRHYDRKVKVVHNGIDVDEFTAGIAACKEEDLRTELGLRRETRIVTSVGRYQEEKGIREFIQAAKTVTAVVENVMFVLVGYKYQRTFDEFKKLAVELGLQESIRFLEFRENIFPVYKSTDLLVSASWIEACPLNIIEAMAAGKPVVATRCGGSEELVVDGETGFLVSPKSPHDLAIAITNILQDPRCGEQMGKLGCQRASRLFDSRRYVSSVEEVLDKAIEEKGLCFNMTELAEVSRAFFECLPQMSRTAMRLASRKLLNAMKG